MTTLLLYQKNKFKCVVDDKVTTPYNMKQGGDDKVTTKKKGPVGRLPEDLDAEVTTYAKANGFSKNQVIIMALRMLLSKKKRGPAA